MADKKITELLSKYLDNTQNIVLEKQLPYIVREKLSQWSTKQFGADIFVFDKDNWQSNLRNIKNTKDIEKIHQAIQINKKLRQSILDL